MKTRKNPGRKRSGCPLELEYREYLNCLPLPELHFEIRELDYHIDKGTTDPSFDLAIGKRGDLAFAASIERFNNFISSKNQADRTLKILSLEEIEKFRTACQHVSVKVIEKFLRKETKKMEPNFDPDTSVIQNLISLLVARASANHGE